MNLGTIKTEVRERLGETTEEDFWKDTQVIRAINEACRRFSQEEKWPWLYTTYTGLTVSAASPSFELIDDVNPSRHFGLALTKQGDTSGRLILPRLISPGDGLRVRAELAGLKGEPRYCFISAMVRNTYAENDPEGMAAVVKILPIPDATYDVEYSYIRDPKVLAADDDEADIPDTYVDAVVSYATGILWLKELNGGGKAQEQFNLYNVVVDQARRQMKEMALDETLVWGRRAPEWRPQDQFPLVNLPTNIGY